MRMEEKLSFSFRTSFYTRAESQQQFSILIVLNAIVIVSVTVLTAHLLLLFPCETVCLSIIITVVDRQQRRKKTADLTHSTYETHIKRDEEQKKNNEALIKAGK